MGDYVGSYEPSGDENVKHVTNEDRSWMHSTGTKDAGEHFYEEEEEEEEEDNEEEECNHEAALNFERESSDTCDSSQQVAVDERGSDPVLSAAPGHQVVLAEDLSESSQSSKDDKPNRKPKPKKTRVARKPFKHLEREPPSASDPGYGGSPESFHSDIARAKSINLVSTWLQDASLEEHPQSDAMLHAQHESMPLQRHPLPRRRPPTGVDMGYGAQASNRSSSSLPVPVPQDEDDAAQGWDKTPASWADPPSGHQYYEDDEEDCRAPFHDASAVPPSIYRQNPKPFDRALKIMRSGAAGFASVSRTAAIGLGNASRMAAVGLRSRTMEIKDMAVPVFTPLIAAVVEESKEQLIGSDQDRLWNAPVAPMGGGPGRGGRGRGRGGRGRGRGSSGPPMARPMQPMMRPGMPGGPGSGMRPVTRPGMSPGVGPGPGMRPGPRPPMRPGMPAGPRPGMRPVMSPGMPTGPRPGLRPGMGPPGHQHAMARGPSMARGSFRPAGARPVASAPAPTN